MTNPYHPPNNVQCDDEKPEDGLVSTEEAAGDPLSYRLVFAYLAFIVFYVLLMGYLL